MKHAISQVCTLRSPLETDLEEFSAAACQTVELWLGKLEIYLDLHSSDDFRQLLAAHQLEAPVASFQGGLFTSQQDARREHWAHFSRRLELCRAVGIGTLVIAADPAGPLTHDAVRGIRSSLSEAAELASGHGVRLALEFQARSAMPNNLETAAALVAEVGHPHLGICLDAFHFFTGPSKTEDLEYLSAANLFHVQLSDLAAQPRELATDADRILPGDGDFPLAEIVRRMVEIGYDGCVSLELMNPQIWSIPPRSVGEIGITALRKVLGQARME